MITDLPRTLCCYKPELARETPKEHQRADCSRGDPVHTRPQCSHPVGLNDASMEFSPALQWMAVFRQGGT